MEISDQKKSFFRHLLYFAFRRGEKATEAARDIFDVYDVDDIA